MGTKNNSRLTIKYIRDLAQQEGSMRFTFNPETLGTIVFLHDSTRHDKITSGSHFFLSPKMNKIISINVSTHGLLLR